jgi:hypothetical protein
MPENDFESLGERLLRAGIAPAHVRRLVTELATHYEALVEEETARGKPLELARVAACSRLGTNDEIIKKVLEQPALRSWGARWPVSICGVAPVLGLVASAVTILVVLTAAFESGRRLPMASALEAGGVAPWVRHGTELIGGLVMYGLPVLWTWALAGYGVSRRLGRVRPLTGFILTAALGATTNVGVVWPRPGVRGQLTAGLGFSTSWDGITRFGTRWLITFALALAVYYLIGRRLQGRRHA